MEHDKSISTIGAIIRAGLNTAPFTGGVASLWSEWDSNRRFQRIEQTIGFLRKEVFARGVDLSKIGEPEMQLLEECINRVSREHREDRRRMFASMLAWDWTYVSNPFDERQLFLRALDAFSEEHFAILRKLNDRIRSGLGPMDATDLFHEIFPREKDDEQVKFGVFLPAYNTVAAEFGMIRRKASEGNKIMTGVNPDGLVFMTICNIMPRGERFVESIQARSP